MEPEGTKQFRLHWINADKSNEINPTKKVGENRGISLFFHFCYDIRRGGDSSCFAKSGVGNLEKGAVQNFGDDSSAFGRFLRFFRSLYLSNHFERGILFILIG